MKKYFKLHPTVFFLGITALFNDISSEMIYPLLPIFLTSIVGVGPAFIGVIEGIAETTSSVLKLFSGYFSDKIGKRKGLILAGYGIANFSRPFIGFATSGLGVLFIRFADKVGKGIRVAPRDALVAATTHEKERGRAFGYQRGMDHFGALVGSAIGFVLLQYFDFDLRTIFLLVIIPGLLAFIFVIIGVKDAPMHKVSLEAKAPVLSLAPFDGRFKYYLVVMLVFTLGNSSDAFLLLKAREVGLPIAMLPLLWMGLHLVKAAFSVPAGIVSDKLNRKVVIIVGWFIYALVYLGFAKATTPTHIWMLFICYGLFFALTEGVEKAFVADLVPAAKTGTAFGLYNFVIGIAALPASLICGLLWQQFGSLWALGFGSALALLAMVMLVFVKEKVPGPNR